MTQSILCRLCVEQCQEYENLYDENGFGTEFYEITFKYFHPKTINLEKCRNLTGICQRCWRQIWDFHNFENMVANAQKRLCDDGTIGATKTEAPDFTESMPKADGPNDHMEGSFISLSEMAAFEADGATPLDALEVCSAALGEPDEDQSKSLKRPADEEIFKRGPAIKLEKEFEVVAVQEGYKYSSDEELPTTSNMDMDIPNFGEDASAVWLSDDSDPELDEDYMPMSRQRTDELFVNEDLDTEISLTGSDGRKTKETRQERNEELEVLLAKWMPVIKCDLCGETCNSWPNLQEHFRIYHPLECCYIPCCGRRLKEHWTIKEHMRYHNDPNVFKCKLCGKPSTTRCALKRHMDAQHPEFQKLIYDCKICGKAFSSESGLKYHCTTVHGDFCQPQRRVQADGSTLFICKDCGKAFQKLDTARQHIWYNHRFIDRYKCQICGNGYRHPRQFREHVASHTRKRLYACAYCPMKFTFLNSLQCHRKVKHPYKREMNSYIELDEDRN
ncbi:transcription factor grauzone isoform X5 [Stomoxys calcitrans]|uniref:C2H2-type domain-containing protein n=1 Tax=Stomoxys calcitrans TaxID=35570 RepID=A0A1I8PL97_STOCA|nr:transcription factor grauzone isoform X5 [Stomoxys calcitrans]XP_059222334.1 transcription factor grauzone isoform X5 [Stomoxys calcitrans]